MIENLNLGQVIGSSSVEYDYEDILTSNIARYSEGAIEKLLEAKKMYEDICRTLLEKRQYEAHRNTNEIVRSIDTMVNVTREHLNYR